MVPWGFLMAIMASLAMITPWQFLPLALTKRSYLAMQATKKRRTPPLSLSFRCSKQEQALLAEAAQRQGISRGRLIRNAALLMAAELLEPLASPAA